MLAGGAGGCAVEWGGVVMGGGWRGRVGLGVTFGRLSVSLLDSLVDVAHKDGRGQPRHT